MAGTPIFTHPMLPRGLGFRECQTAPNQSLESRSRVTCKDKDLEFRVDNKFVNLNLLLKGWAVRCLTDQAVLTEFCIRFLYP